MGADELERAAQHLARNDVHALALIGGNGTMTLAARLAEASRDQGHELAVMGIPKTVDNDLVATDRAPGYASAARFMAQTVRDLADDQRAMGGLEDVRLIESIGRDVGWVAMASFAARTHGDAPHLVFAPERQMPVDDVIEQIVRSCEDHGPITAVIAEGFAPELMDHAFQRPTFDRLLVGGVSRVLADRLGEAAGYSVRADVLGMIQRSCTAQASRVDRGDADVVGAAAARALAAGRTGEMVTLEPLVDIPRTSTVPLEKVAGTSRPVPDGWLGATPAHCPSAFLQWVDPLLSAGEPHEPEKHH